MPEFDPNQSASPEAQSTYKVKVNGVEQEVPVADLLKAYEKVGGADQRFEEAARLRREAELLKEQAEANAAAAKELQHQKALLQRINNGDQSALLEYFKTLGLSDEEAAQAVASQNGSSKSNGGGGQSPPSALSQEDRALMLQFQQFMQEQKQSGVTPADLRRMQLSSQARDTDEVQKWVKSEAEKNSGVLAKLFKSPKGKDFFAEFYEDFDRTAKSGVDIHTAIKQVTKAKVEKYDTLFNAFASSMTDATARIPSGPGILSKTLDPGKAPELKDFRTAEGSLDVGAYAAAKFDYDSKRAALAADGL